MKKRILSCLMALALCLTLLPATAQAADEHQHCVCGKTPHVDIGDHTVDQITFDKWLGSSVNHTLVVGGKGSQSESYGDSQTVTDGKYVLTDGNYYLKTGGDGLEGNVTIEYPIQIKGNVTICLNGKWIENVGKTTGSVFEVPTDSTLTLTNCTGDGRIKCDSSSGVYVSGGTLNLYSGQIANSKGQKGTDSNNKYGGGVYVNSGFFNMYGGTITGNDADYGGGVYVKNGTFNMYGGTIKNNKSYGGSGAGVYVEASGNFIMKNTASVTGNTIGYGSTAGAGGGVYVNGGTFEMYDTASVTGNKASNSSGSSGGGVYVSGGKFTMNGNASVTDNEATYDNTLSGGGVYVEGGEFTMNGNSKVMRNAASGNKRIDGNGGGVYVKGGKFEMNGEETSVSNNTAATNGGGVHMDGGTFTMKGGTIGGTTDGEANTADQGGGVYVSSGTFTMSGGSITGNDGNGVFVHDNAATTFTVSGAPTVTGNTRNSAASNVFLAGSKTITIGDKLDKGASIGVTKKPLQVDKAIATGATEDYSSNFSIDDTQQYVVKHEGDKLVLAEKSGGTTNPPVTTEHKHCLCGKTHTDVGDHTSESQIEFATKLWYDKDNKKLMMGEKEWTAEKVKLYQDYYVDYYVLKAGSYYLNSDISLKHSIRISGDVKLCLNGFSIISDGTETGRHVIIVEGSSLTLTDCKGSGKITHADRKNGGGVSVYDPSSVFNMFGGIITGNNIDGGVKNNGTFNMYGGEISDNEAGNGGGVYVNQVGKFNMYGGSITGNRSVRGKGSGVYVNGGIEIPGGSDSASTKIVKITGNTEDNLYLAEGKVIKLGSVHYQTSVGVTTAVKPEKGNHVKIADVTSGDVGLPKNITSDDPQYVTERVGATLVLKTKETEILVSGITLNGEKWNLKVGDTQEITATVAPNDATKKDVIWTSSNTDVATVENGTVTAVKAGTTTITATAADGSGKSATCTVTVTGGTTPPQPSNPGGSTGGNTGGSSGSSSSDSSDSNPIIKTETKNNADGSTTKTETRKDGSVTQTTTGKDGSVSKTETKKDGSSVTENKAADGSTGTVKTDKNGQTEAKTALSNKAIEDAKKSSEPVKAPVEVEASRNSGTAPTVKVELPKNAGETEVEIPVSNVKPGTVAVLVHPDGTEEILKASVPTENGIRLTVDGSATVKIVDNSKDFVDTRNHWAREEIDFVSARELVNGMSDTIYAPNASATRAQLWTILARQNDTDLSGGANWYEKAQLWSKDKGISDGTEPNAAINRAQMVTMLWRTMGQPAAGGAATFTDVPADSYYASAVAWAVESGITQGVGGGRFDPTATCTRAQIAAFLARSMK